MQDPHAADAYRRTGLRSASASSTGTAMRAHGAPRGSVAARRPRTWTTSSPATTTASRTSVPCAQPTTAPSPHVRAARQQQHAASPGHGQPSHTPASCPNRRARGQAPRHYEHTRHEARALMEVRHRKWDKVSPRHHPHNNPFRQQPARGPPHRGDQRTTSHATGCHHAPSPPWGMAPGQPPSGTGT